MGRGVSAGGGQSSLGYLFGGGEAPNNSQAPSNGPITDPKAPATSPNNPQAPSKGPTSTDPKPSLIPAGVPGSTTNNYFRADGQNCGNFLTERPSTKVHAAPGGGSSLDYLFGGESK